MKNVHKISIIIIAYSLLSGCQSSVRFSASEYEIKTKYERPVSKRHNKPNSNSKDALIKQIELAESSSNESNSEYRDPEIRMGLNGGEARVELISEAYEWLGTPYKWGGESLEGADCSGFVQSVYYKLGVNLPRTAQDQYEYCNPIEDEEELQPGDLIFFKRSSRVTHVGIYIGENKMIHASSRNGVIIQYLDKYNYYKNKDHLAGFGRALN